MISCKAEESIPQREIMISEGEGPRKEPVIHNKLQNLEVHNHLYLYCFANWFLHQL